MLARVMVVVAVAAVLLAASAVRTPSPSTLVRSLFTASTGTPERPSAIITLVVPDATDIVPLGVERLGGNVLPTADTLYEIGSITKGITGILLAEMVLSGDVRLHDSVGHLLRGGDALPAGMRDITLLQLATHRSGLPRLPENLEFELVDLANPYAEYDAAKLETFLREHTRPQRADPQPLYSNLGYGLLGYLLAARAGQPFEALVKARVLMPLDMRDTTITLSDDQRARLAPGYAAGALTSNWDLGALEGAGALRSSGADMAKLLTALMRPPRSRIGDAIRMAIEPRGRFDGEDTVGFAWISSRLPNGRQFVFHDGGTGGYRSFIGFTPDGTAGIAVLTNGSDAPPDPLAVAVLQQLAPS